MEVEQRGCDEIGNGRQVNDVQKWKKVANKWKDESKVVWQIAGPAILTAVSQFSFGFVTAAFVGQIGHVELAAVSEVQNVVEGFVYGIMVIKLFEIRVVFTESFVVYVSYVPKDNRC